jgi:hypothetical protein
VATSAQGRLCSAHGHNGWGAFVARADWLDAQDGGHCYVRVLLEQCEAAAVVLQRRRTRSHG